MKVKVIYSILGGEKQSQLIKIPNELIDELKELNPIKASKASQILGNKLKETICKEKGLDSFELKIHEFYEKKPKQKKSKPQQQQGFER